MPPRVRRDPSVAAGPAVLTGKGRADSWPAGRRSDSGWDHRTLVTASPHEFQIQVVRARAERLRVEASDGRIVLGPGPALPRTGCATTVREDNAGQRFAPVWSRFPVRGSLTVLRIRVRGIACASTPAVDKPAVRVPVAVLVRPRRDCFGCRGYSSALQRGWRSGRRLARGGRGQNARVEGGTWRTEPVDADEESCLMASETSRRDSRTSGVRVGRQTTGRRCGECDPTSCPNGWRA